MTEETGTTCISTTQVSLWAKSLRELAGFEQCPNPSGSLVSGKVRDEILKVATELESLLKH